MIPVAEASARIQARIAPLTAETVATANAGGRVLAEPVVAPLTSPPWDNSSMDGYALLRADIESGNGHAQLRVVEEIAAGKFPSRPIQHGEAMRVMTGAPIPSRADTVVRREDTDDGRETVTIMKTRDAGKNIRRKGEDFHSGDTLFEAGDPLSIAHLGALASAGVKTVSVRRRPRVAIISSGDELIELDDFTPELAGTRIVSSNSLTLAALVRDAGGEPLDMGIARDDPADLRDRLAAARGADLIVTSAGISVGDHDHVRDVFAELGGVLDFWKVRMRPGAPLAFGTLGGTPWIGLSGNPVSAIVTFEVFVRPAIRGMLGFRSVFRRTISAKLAHPMTLAAPLMHFIRVVVTRDAEGEYVAQLSGSQSSSVLTAMARANALLILPGDRLELAAGETYRALPIGDALDVTEELVLE
ncbi:MAG: gephyrin-like molybdotransferase Glp [Gemmatimonadales bacterium]